MGRPTKYTKPLAMPRSFRLMASDDEKFAANLAASGLETSEFVRDYVLRNKIVVVARLGKATTQTRLERLRLIGLVAKAGNNINQLARRANTDYKAGVVSAGTYEAILDELEAISVNLKASLPC